MIKKRDICMTVRDIILHYDNGYVVPAGTIVEVVGLQEMWMGTHAIERFDIRKDTALFNLYDLEEL